MAQRITKDDLRIRINKIRVATGGAIPITLYGAYGKVQAVIEEGSGHYEISKLMSKSQLYEWLNAFEKGLQQGKKLCKKHR